MNVFDHFTAWAGQAGGRRDPAADRLRPFDPESRGVFGTRLQEAEAQVRAAAFEPLLIATRPADDARDAGLVAARGIRAELLRQPSLQAVWCVDRPGEYALLLALWPAAAPLYPRLVDWGRALASADDWRGAPWWCCVPGLWAEYADSAPRYLLTWQHANVGVLAGEHPEIAAVYG